MFLPIADKLELTVVDLEPPGDAWFPKWDAAQWREIESDAHDGEPGFEFKTLVRAKVGTASPVKAR